MATPQADKVFHCGQRVQMTPLAIARHLSVRGATTGVVCGRNNLRGPYVRVKRDGAKTVSRYHVDFWEPEAPR